MITGVLFGIFLIVATFGCGGRTWVEKIACTDGYYRPRHPEVCRDHSVPPPASPAAPADKK